MPELPEVEVVRRTLEKHLVGREFVDVEVYHDDIIHQPARDVIGFQKNILHHSIAKIERYGKYLILVLSSGWLVVHLRMTGKLLWTDHFQLRKHMHFKAILDDGSYLLYEDVRRFGGFSFYSHNPYQEKPFSELGPDALSDEFNGRYLYQCLQGRRRHIKSLLLDQHIVAGLGNIYADEVLAAACIHPARKASDISETDAVILTKEIKRILAEAIKKGGSSIRDYTDGNGKQGSFQNEHRVYGRAGEPCYRCGRTLEKIKVSGRSTVFCPHCQAR